MCVERERERAREQEEKTLRANKDPGKGRLETFVYSFEFVRKIGRRIRKVLFKLQFRQPGIRQHTSAYVSTRQRTSAFVL